MIENNLIAGIKFVLFVDTNVDVEKLYSTFWIAANNIDPMRDSKILNSPQSGQYVVAFDAGMKTYSADKFERDWPNIVVSDDKTIALVDEKWNKYGIGEFIKSPSLTFKTQIFNQSAIASLTTKNSNLGKKN